MYKVAPLSCKRHNLYRVKGKNDYNMKPEKDKQEIAAIERELAQNGHVRTATNPAHHYAGSSNQ